MLIAPDSLKSMFSSKKIDFYAFSLPRPAGFFVSRKSPYQITFNLPASTKQETYLVVRLGPNSQKKVVGVYPSTPSPAQRSFAVEPGTTYRFELLAVDQKTGQMSLVSNKVIVSAPQAGESYFSPISLGVDRRLCYRMPITGRERT